MLEQLQILSPSIGAYIFVVVMGLLWGSFANVCIYRWPPSDEFPNGRSVVAPGSHCFVCKTPIRWYDNVPLLAYLWLRGKCRTCKTAFSPRYLIVEASLGVLFAVAWWSCLALGPMRESFGVTLARFVIEAAFLFVMVVVTFIDIDHKLILNKVTFPSIAIFYAATWLLPERTWWDGLVGAAIGYGLPWLIGEIYYRVTKREGLGLGDSTLLAVIGALLGWRGVIVSLFGGSVIGSVIGIAVLVATKKPAAETIVEDGSEDDEGPGLMRSELPFGPFLAAGAVFYLFAEPWIQLRFGVSG